MNDDQTESPASYPMRRFYLQRKVDTHGVSGSGRVLEGALLQSGLVICEWRPPLSSICIYHSYAEFLKIHVGPLYNGANEVVWLDTREPWHCFSCGATGWIGHACERCGDYAYDDPSFPRTWRRLSE